MSNTVKIDPAHFVVRRESYQQIQGYPEACAQLTEELIAHSPATFPQAFAFVTEKMKKSPVLNRDWTAAIYSKGFAQPRDNEAIFSTTFGRKFAGDAGYVHARLGDKKEEKITYASAAHPHVEGGIELSTLRRPNENVVSVRHPDIGPNAQMMDEHRWSAICHTFDIAMDVKKPQPVRQHATKECYALLSHDCTYARGSATLSQVMLQYLAHKTGLEVPLTKIDVDLNTKAMTRSVEEFVREWDGGEYFDKQATSQTVMKWHKSYMLTPESVQSGVYKDYDDYRAKIAKKTGLFGWGKT